MPSKPEHKPDEVFISILPTSFIGAFPLLESSEWRISEKFNQDWRKQILPSTSVVGLFSKDSSESDPDEMCIRSTRTIGLMPKFDGGPRAESPIDSDSELEVNANLEMSAA